MLSKTVLLAALVLSLPAMAQEEPSGGQFFTRKSEGWFWYHDPKDDPKPPPPPQPEPAKPSAKEAEKAAPAKAAPFSVEWLRVNMPKLLDAAVNNPTKENVEAYLYAQRVTMDKSQRYAEQAQRVVASDPFLDENNRVPIASYTKPFFLRQAQEGKIEALKHISSVGGLWVFFDSKCHYCAPQVNTANELAKKYGLITKFISMDGKGLPSVKQFVRDRGQAKRLNLKITPTTVLVVPPNNYFVVSQGMMAQDQLIDRILLAADSNSLLPKEMSAKLNSYDRGVLTNEDTQQGRADDPKEWVKYLKDRLENRY
ncbi:conjugal transfer protein TraF [Noviherbaspirillum pedocola]|uniref:Conjugal transfer protein TraF n=1 Tax=Noviherbaspirillum pedocola TaxID=2801341 RepID=A0A934W8P8_9BURK|nr:conjugal transfer protein TraF [Noviherbaspirillum pedocola]MBK4737830.1 conjugal transfer protein TraF [Noviherbaspirillum pedocola]